MLFRPKFCANCGGKIERADWRLWTSRRFCQVCEIELKEYEILPKAIGVALSVITIVAVGISFSSRSQTSDLRELKQESKKETALERHSEPANTIAQVVAAPVNEIQPGIRNLASTTGQQKLVEKKPKIEIDEVPSFCGAETKKGTPCSRRVKGATRCYQHHGMPAMTVAETQEKRGQR